MNEDDEEIDRMPFTKSGTKQKKERVTSGILDLATKRRYLDRN